MSSNNEPMESERKYQVNGISYIIRGLKSTEIDAWAEFCASVFAYKKNPPHSSYFSRHFTADPERQSPLWIRAALVDGKQIVASCRVFIRRVSAGNNQLLTGAGIGEVCTDVAHRRRGLATQLLMDAFSIIDNGPKSFDFSFLHASEIFFGFYRSVGYTISAVSRWYTAHIDRHLLATQADRSPLIRMAKFPNDVDQLLKLHQRYSEQRVRGSIIRSLDYWVNYMSEELKGNLHILYSKQNGGEEEAIGWLSLRLRDDDGPITKMQLRVWVYRTRDELLFRSHSHEEISPCIRLHFPGLVLEDVHNSCAENSLFKDVSEEIEQGWMYKPLANPGVLSQVVAPDSHHFIWPTDSF